MRVGSFFVFVFCFCMCCAAGAQEQKKEWTPPQRNFEKIEFEDLRKQIDAKFNELHDSLSVAYYNFWKHGESKPFFGYDVQATPEQSKAQFDELHAYIWHKHFIEFHLVNIRRPKKDRIPEERYNIVVRLHPVTGDTIRVAKRDTMRIRKINELEAKNIRIPIR